VGTSVYLQDRLQSLLNATARRAGRQNTQLHCYGSFTGCASRSESSSGCVFLRTIVCMAQHRRTCLTTCGRHLRSSLVAVSALLTPRCHLQVRSTRRATLGDRAFWCLQRGAGMEQSATRDSGLLLTFEIAKGYQVSPFCQSYG